MQEHKQKCVRLVPNVEYKHNLKPPRYLSHFHCQHWFNCMNINVTKNRSIIPMNLLGPYSFNLQTTAFYELRSLRCFYHCCGKHLMSAILESGNVHQWYPQLIYNIYTIVQRGVSLTRPRRLGADHLPWSWHICLSIEYRSRNRQWNLWTLSDYVSSWWCPVWLRYRLYMICTRMSNWDGLWWPALYGHRLSCNGWQKWLTHSKSIILMCLQ